MWKSDDKDRITYIAAYLRPGKEMPFDKIGQLEKAPVLTDRVVAWDVGLESNRPLIACCRAWVRAKSELHHDVYRETTAHRLAEA